MAKIYPYLLLFAVWILGNQNSTAQTVVTPATAVSNLCVGGGYTTLSTITIAEGVATDFTAGAGRTYILSVPANMQFNTGVTPTVTSTGGGITNIVASVPTATTFTFTFDVAGGSVDQIMIDNIQVQAITAPSSGNLARSGGSVVMAGNAAGAQNHCSLTSLANVSITGQPGNQTICTGASPSFTVTATGASLTYSWELSTDGGTMWAAAGAGHTGVTTATVTYTGATVAQNGWKYRCVVSGTCGGPITSNVVTLTVNAAVAISTQPSNTSVCTNDPATFTVVATGVGLTYIWEKSTNGGGSWATQNGVGHTNETTATIQNDAATAGENGYLYRAVVSSTCGGPVTSSSATLTVGGLIAGITTSPTNQTICSGGTATFSVVATNVVTYQWQENSVNISDGGVYSGTNTNSLTLTGVTTAMGMSGRNYRVVVTGACGSPATSTARTLTVNPVATPTIQPSNQAICVGANASFTVAGTNITGYQWQLSTTGAGGPFSNLFNVAPHSNVTTATLNITSPTALMSGYVYRCVLSSASCGTTNTNTATLTVNSPGVATYFGLDPAYCRNSAVDTLEGFPTGGTFSGPGVGATNGAGKAPFNPFTAGSGAKTITYTLGCTNVVKNTTVNDSSNIAYTSPSVANPTYSTTDAPVDLVVELVPPTGPLPGTYTGTGVSGSKFYPNIAGPGGPYPVTFTYTNGNNCTSKVSKPFTVYTPGLGIPPLAASNPYCVNGASVMLDETSCQGGSPGFSPPSFTFGGYTGTGISYLGGNTYMFTPTTAGSHTITYWVNYDFFFFSFTVPYASQTVTVNPLTAPSFTLPASICSYGGLINMNPSPGPATGGGGTMSIVSPASPNPLTGASNTFFDPSVVTTAMGNTTFTVRYTYINASGCSSYLDQQITVYPKPGLPTLYSPDGFWGASYEEYCYASGRKYVGAIYSSSTDYNWYNNVSLSLASKVSDYYYLPPQSPVDDAPGTYNYYVTQTISGCTSNPLTVTVKINDRAVVTAGSDQTICEGSTATLNGTSHLTVASGTSVPATWSSPTLGGFTPSASNLGAVYTPTATDISNQFVNLTITSNDPDGAGPCPVATDIVRINVNRRALANAGSDVTYCSNNTIFLQGTYGGSASSITWTGGTGTINSPSSLVSTYSLTNAEKAGSVIPFTLTTNDPDGAGGPCLAASDVVSITISPEAVVTAGSDQTICEATNPSLTGTSNRFGGGTAVTATWSSPTSGGFSPNVNNLTPVYTPTTADLVNQYVDLTLTSNDPDGVGPCTVSSDQVRININPGARTNAGSDITYCSNNTIFLQGTYSGSASSITWTGGTGTINSPTALVSTYSLTNAEKAGSVIPFTITTNDPDGVGPCVAASDVVSITISPEAVVTAGTDQIICEGTDPNLTGTCNRFGGTAVAATWSSPTSGGFSPDVNNMTPVYTPTATDIVNQYVDLTLTSNDPDGVGPCSVSSDQVRININPAARVDAGSDATYCSNNTIFLQGSYSGSASSITWTGGAGTRVSPNAPVSQYLATPGEKTGGGIPFTLTTNDPDGVGPTGPCPVASDVVIITINPEAVVNAGPDQVVCRSGSTVINITGASRSGGSNSATWSGGSGTFGAYTPTNTNLSTSYTAAAAELPANGGINNSFYLYLTSDDPDGAGPTGPCGIVVDSMMATINPLPRVDSVIVPAIGFCKSDNLFQINVSYQSTYAKQSDSYTDLPVGNTGVSGNYFVPSFATIGTHTLRYTFTDINGCSNFKDTLINVYGVPKPKFTISSYCATSPITFDGATSDISFDPASTINYYKWNFGDFNTESDTSLLVSDAYTYNKTLNPSAKQTYTVKLIAGTNHGCYGEEDSTITVGNIPAADFTWTKICPADITSYKDASNFPFAEVSNYTWTFGTEAVASGSTLAFKDYDYKFLGSTGAYMVKFKITSKIGCIDSITQKVNILDEYKPTATDPYTRNFVSTDGFWSVDGQNPSWQWGAANKTNIATGTRNVWVTNTAGPYNVNEKSYINGPCLDFTALTRPMITLKINSATQSQIAGAVLQSSSDGGATWNVVGAMGSGLNWYDNFGVLGNPGNQTVNQFAWTGTYPDWKISKYNLNNLAGSASVRFRLAFGSGQDTLNLTDGFALDSIWVGNRDKVLLVENFTNSSTTTVIASDNKMNTLVSNRPNDLVAIHYHAGFPGSDPMNLRNQADPSARVLHYGVPKIPYVVFDGNYNYGDTLRDVNVDKRSLDPALFKIKMATDISGSSVKVKARVIANDSISNSFVVHAVVVERNVTAVTGANGQTNFQWVATRMLPDAGGSFFNQNFSKNDSADLDLRWDYFPSEVYDPNQLGVVVFIQDVATKEVYQTSYALGTGNPSNMVITGVNNILSGQGDVNVFPNPSSKTAYVMFNQNIDQDLDWTVYDQLGKVMDKGKISKGSQGFALDTSAYPDAVYAVKITDGDSVLFKKLMVTH
jgi:hypothetical protein